MTSKRQGTVFTVVMAALGLMALLASPSGAQWLESGAAIESNKSVEVGKHTEKLALYRPSLFLEISCSAIGGSTMTLNAGSLTTAQGSVEFSSCAVLIQGELQKACAVDNFIASSKAKLIVHSGRTYVLLEPLVAGGNFTTIKILGELCVLPESYNVRGSLVAECVTTISLAEVDCLSAEVTHGLREALNASTLFPSDGILFGTTRLDALGVVTTKLASGNSWAGHL